MTDPTTPSARPQQPPRRPTFNLEPLTQSAPDFGGPLFWAATAVCAVIMWTSGPERAFDFGLHPKSAGLSSILDSLASIILTATRGFLGLLWSPLIAAILTPRLAREWPPHWQRTLAYARRGAFITGITLGLPYLPLVLFALAMLVTRPWGIFAFVVPLGSVFRLMVPGALLGVGLGLARHRPGPDIKCEAQ